MFKKLILSVGILGALGGCATSGDYAAADFTCSGIAEGLRCMSVKEAHDLTVGEDYEERLERISIRAKHLREKMEDEGYEEEEIGYALKKLYQDEGMSGGKGSMASRQQPDISAFEDKVMPGIIPYHVKQVLPLRTPAKVLRVAVNSWESEDGILHVPGYMYVEIEPRRWQIGDREQANNPHTFSRNPATYSAMNTLDGKNQDKTSSRNQPTTREAMGDVAKTAARGYGIDNSHGR